MTSSVPQVTPSVGTLPVPAECLTHLLTVTTDLIFVLDRQQRWVLVSEALCQFLKLHRDDLLGQASGAVLADAYATQFSTHNATVLATGQASEQEECFVRADGDSSPVTVRRSRFIDSRQRSFLVGVLQIQAPVSPTEVSPTEVSPTDASHGTQPSDKHPALLRALPDLVMQMSGDGVYLDFIPTQGFNVFGSHELIGTRIEGSLPDELVTRRMQVIRTALATGEMQVYEQELWVDGTLRTEEVRVVVSGENEVLLIVRDMTDRKQAELALAQLNEELEARIQERTVALRASEARLRTLLDHLPIGCWAADLEKRHIMQNPVSIRQWGNLIGKRPQDLNLPPEVLTTWLENHQRVLAGETLHLENHYDENGQLEHYQSILAPIWDNSKICGFLGVDIKVTQQKQTEAALRQQEERLRLILEQMPVMMTAFDENGIIQVWNNECERVTGYRAQEMIGNPKAIKQIYPNATARRRLRQRWQTLGNHFRNQEWEITCRDGTHRTILWSNLSAQFPIPGWAGWSVGIDISDRKQMEEALRESEEKTRALLQVIPDMLFCYDRDGIHLDFSPSTEWQTLVPPELFLGKPITEILPADPAQKILTAVRQALDTQALQRIEYKLPLEAVWHDYEARVVAMDAERALVIVRDISDRKQQERQIRDSEQQLRQQAQELTTTLKELQRTQSQLIHNEKMSSLGQLVAGVAHEINNPVNFIFGNLTYVNEYVQSLLKVLRMYQTYDPNPGTAIQQVADTVDLDFIIEDLPNILKSMHVGAERIQAIVASLRTFSRMDEAEMKAVNIHDGIDSALMILQSRFKINATQTEILVVKNYADLPPIECYAGQLNQVFMNILVNAIDAIEEGPPRDKTNPPHILITTERLTAERVGIQIADNGPGITAAAKQRLFDPFFTTKAVGKGTGMGLSISYQIVTERHGGTLTCRSEPDEGATFCIEIPIFQSVCTTN